MRLDVNRFYRACNPTKTLDKGKSKDVQLYVDFSSVRGGKIIDTLTRRISRCDVNESCCQLFTGHIGCGKSTELLALKANLQRKGFYVVYFDSSVSLDLADVNVTDILLAITHEVVQSLKANRITFKSGLFKDLLGGIQQLFPSIDLDIKTEVEICLGIAKIIAQTKDSPTLHNQLKQYLEPRITSLLNAINQDILIPAKKKLTDEGKKGLVVIIDNLEKMDNTLRTGDYTQAEYLFVHRGDKLKQLNCHTIYTMPLVLRYSDSFTNLTDLFGQSPGNLPMVPVGLQDGSEYDEGVRLLQEMVMKRAFPGVSWEQSKGLINLVFDNADTFRRLCLVSGGHVRNLLRLLCSCMDIEEPPLSRECIEKVIKRERNNCMFLDDKEWNLLRQIVKQKNLGGNRQDQEEYQRFIRHLLVFEYYLDDESWFNVNPILIERKEIKNHL
ncbi:MAG: ATP-binding protein [Cyanobacteria bacterium P01_A01_bin.84]